METFELYLTPVNSKQFKAIVTKSPVGEGETESSLPFFEGEVDWRMTLLRTLEMSAFNSQYFQTAGEQDWMVKSGILSKDISAFHPNYIANIGQELYKSLFPLGSKVKNALLAAQQVVDSENKQLHIRLKFEADVVQRSRLADYPWELLHDGEKFLLHQQVTISRYIAYNSLPPNLAKVERLNVLLVSSSASDSELGLNPFKPKEQQAILKGLKSAEKEGCINFNKLDYATLDYLREYLTENRENNAPHVFHFDGHGLFGKRCSHCGAMNKGVKAATCRKCDLQLPQAQGYLVFQDEDGDADYISAEELGTLLQQSSFGDGTNKTGGVTIAVLSACQSAMTFVGDSVFNGTAQNLISHRIPAVVAMQYSVGVEAAAKFAEQFYRSLGQKNSLAIAISQAREAMGIEGNQWYRPVLYLRWKDNEGGQPVPPPPKSATGIPFQAPPKPSSYVDRQEYSQDLKARLLTKSSSNAGILESIAIHGMGSVGKSTLVAGLAHDPEVRKHFCDGILWVTLGQEPKVLELLGGWVQALGDYNQLNANEEVMSKRLGDLLQDKAVLLIVDDAWNTEYIKYFKVGGSSCKILVTTRESAIAKVLGASIYSLDVMKPEQAMELLTKLLGRNLQDLERQEAEALAKAVGYLPLALELAAAQVKGGIRWAVLLQDLQQEVARLKTFDDPEAGDFTDEASLKRFSLTASLNLSIQRLPEENRLDFTWLGVLPEDVNITQMMTATLWDTDERDAFDKLRYLGSKALLLPSIPLADGTLTYRLHDLLHDLARNLLTASITPKRRGDLPGLGLSFATAQVNFLQQYRQKTQKNLWHTLPNDGYIHQRLVWHLENAGQIEEIHQLLQEESQTERNGWYEARERLGETGGYLTDVARAWELIKGNWTEATLSKVISLQCRYALITVSVNSLAANLSEGLLVALVKKNVWNRKQGLAYALQIPDLRQKVISLRILIDYLPQSLKDQALQAALQAFVAIESDTERDTSLNTLINKLPVEFLPQVFQAVVAIPDEYRCIQALSILADKLPADLLPQAFQAAIAIKDKYCRAKALLAFIDKIPEALLQAFRATVAIQNEQSRGKFLIALADKLPADLLSQAFEATMGIKDEDRRTEILIALADKLPADLLSQAFQATASIQNKYERAQALIDLADKVQPSLLPYQALQVTLTIEDEDERIKVLIALADKLSTDLLLQAFEAAIAFKYKELSVQALTDLADKLPAHLLPQAFKLATNIQDQKERAKTLSALAWTAKLPTELLHQIFQAIVAIQDKQYRSFALISFIEKLPAESDLFPQVFQAVVVTQDESRRASALSTLVKKLPAESDLFPQVFQAVVAIPDEYQRAEVLSTLVKKLPAESDLLPQALKLARNIQSGGNCTRVLIALAEKLPVDLFPQILQLARTIKDEYSRGAVLFVLVEKLPELLPELLQVARTIQNKPLRASALIALAKELPVNLPEALQASVEIDSSEDCIEVLKILAEEWPVDLLSQAFQAAMTIENEYYRVHFLRALAEKQPINLFSQAIKTTITDIQNDYHRHQILVTLVEELPEDLLSQALEEAIVIKNDYNRDRVLITLVNKLSKDSLPKALQAAIAIQSEVMRADILIALAEKLPVDLLPQALQAVKAIEDEEQHTKVLMTLINKLPEHLFSEALEAVIAIKSKNYRFQSLNTLADKLPEDLLLKALQATTAIEDENNCTNALIALAVYLPKDLLTQVVQATVAIHNEEHRTNALIALVDKLPENLLLQVVQVAKLIQDKYHQAKVLIALADKLPSVLPEALQVAIAIKNEENRAYALNTLVNKLPEDSLPKILQAAKLIQNKYHQASVLIALADKLPSVLPEAFEAAKASGNVYFLIALADKLPAAVLEALEAAKTEDEYSRVKSLYALVNKLPENLLPEALQLVMAIKKENNAELLITLAGKLPSALPHALQAIKSTRDITHHALLLRVLALEVPAAFPEAFRAAMAIREDNYLTITLRTLVYSLPENLLTEALEAARTIKNETSRADILIALVDKLPSVLPEALEAARAIEYEESRAYALISLATQIPAVWSEALQSSLAIQHEYKRAEALKTLVIDVPEYLLPNILQAVRSSHNDTYRLSVMFAIFARADNLTVDQLFLFWQDALHLLSLDTRPNVMQYIETLFPVIFALGGEAATAEIARAIQDVARWWR